VACLAVCGTLGLPSATSAQDPGVHFDSGSPAGKEYAIPLAEGRAEGAGTTNQRAAANTPFGAGITPPGSGGGSGVPRAPAPERETQPREPTGAGRGREPSTSASSLTPRLR
jgi:hypothetical protein